MGANLFRGGPVVFYFATRNIDHELGKLGGIAGTFWALGWHNQVMPLRLSHAPDL
jgi:hypothetical protein